MPKLAWFDIFKIGNEEIDQAHKTLITHAQRIEDCLDDPASSSEVSIFIDIVKKHCHREEEILLSCKYPKLVDHKIFHEELLTKAIKLEEACTANANKILKSLYYDSLVDCIINDFLKADMDFKTHLLHQSFGS